MFTRYSRIVRLGLMAALSGCAGASQLNPLSGMSGFLPTKSPPEQVAGPDSAFAIRTPRLLTPDAHVSTDHDKSGAWSASFGDDLCRAFGVTVIKSTSTAPIGELVHTRSVPEAEKQGAVQIVERTDTLENIGEASFVRYQLPKRAPCRNVQNTGSLGLGRKTHQPDAEVAHYTFRHGDLLFDVTYVREINEAPAGRADPNISFGIRVGPTDEVLREFVAGITFRQ